MNPPATKTVPDNYVGFRDRLNAAEIRWCVAGGQAVNIWGAHYLSAKPILGALSPFTSKNFDPLLISPKSTEKCPEIQIVDWKGDSAICGSVTIPGMSHQGELLKFLPGIPDGQWIHRIRTVDGWPVSPPDALYATTCWNILNFPQEGRQDMRHLFALNYVLEAHLARVEQDEREAILKTFQQLADAGTVARVMEVTGPDLASTITSRVAIPHTPSPRFHVCSGLDEEIRKARVPAPAASLLSFREEGWAVALVQFHDREVGERLFIEACGDALQTYLANLREKSPPCQKS